MPEDETTILSGLLAEGEVGLAPGTVVDERFKVSKLVGRGGMCSVYEAEHMQLKRRVAIKLLHLRRIASPEAVNRFQREAILASDVKHPNIIEIHGFGVWQRRPYIVMEFLEGETLNALVEENGPLPEKRATEIFLQISKGMQCAHEHKVVHRDLKPSNVIITGETDHVKIVDFGIARLLPESSEEVQKLTQTGQVLGTFLYMSPEQCMGRPVDERTDIYSFGCLMYKVLTGKPPFNAEIPYELMGMHLNEAPPAMPGVSQRMQLITKWCLKKDPKDRPHSFQQLKSVFEGEDLSATAAVSIASASGMPQAKLRVRSRNNIAFVGGVVILLLGAAGGWLAYSKRPPEAPAYTTQEKALLSSIALAQSKYAFRDVGAANLQLAKLYVENEQWVSGEKAGRAAIEAYREAGDLNSSDYLDSTFYTGVAMQNKGKMISATSYFKRLSEENNGASPALRARAALHCAQCAIAMMKWKHADFFFAHAYEGADAKDFPDVNLRQQIRLEYAQFLLHQYPTDKPELSVQRIARARQLFQEVVKEGAPTPEAAPGVEHAKQELAALG